MPRTITKTIYTFAELLELHEKKEATGSALERAKEWLRECATDHEWWEYTYETWTLALSQIGFLDIEIAFSGFWSQGDGASFTSKRCDLRRLTHFLSNSVTASTSICPDPNLPDFLVVNGVKEDFRPWAVQHSGDIPIDSRYARLGRLGGYVNYIHVEVSRTSSNYSHENTCVASVDVRGGHGNSKPFNKLVNDFELNVEILRRHLSRGIYKSLEAEYEAITGDESLADLAEANDYTFTIDGKREG